MTIQTFEDHRGMKESNRIVCEVLDLLEKHIRPGVTTKELDEIAEDFMRSKNALPAFKGYRQGKNSPFPASICTSVDSEVVHGIPGDRKLVEGEIISIDVGVNKDGYFGDSARTFPVGQIDARKTRLLEITRKALYVGIGEAKVGRRVHDISAAIQEFVESAGFSIVRELVGHGIGKSLHEEPAVPNYGVRGTGSVLKEGIVLAIEPMVNAGGNKIKVAKDGWTILTVDGEPSAHFEHTVIVRNGEPEILTKFS